MWPFTRTARPSPDAVAASDQAERALTDAENLDGRLEQIAQQSAEIRRFNHIAAAVAKSIRGA
jgi:hypothetical protein